jgi:hypothetical protein
VSKSQTKKRKKSQRTPNIPSTATLRPRLDALWHSDTLANQDDAAILEDLETATQGIKAALLLPVVLAACHAAPPEAQERLNDVLPAWVQRHHHQEPLRQLITRNTLEEEHEALALAWLEEAGSDISDLVEHVQQSSFVSAYYFHDTTDQAELFLYFYTSRRHNRVQGFDFLIDHNPPWNGAIKDVTITHARRPEKALDELFNFWSGQRKGALQEVDAPTTWRILRAALACNRAMDIGLPGYMLALRDKFMQHVLSLPRPDDDDIPPFDSEALDYLLDDNRASSETLQQYEEDVGYFIRGSDGTRQFIASEAEDLAYSDDDDDDDDAMPGSDDLSADAHAPGAETDTNVHAPERPNHHA